jgi:hypothetical protein
LTTFSQGGNLGQLEHALKAVSLGSQSVGVRAKNGAVVGCESNPINLSNDCGESEQLEQQLRRIRTTRTTIAANPINLSNDCGQSEQLEQRLRPIRTT